MTDIPGAREALLAQAFFAALGRCDAPALAALLDETPAFENMDGRHAALDRDALAARLARRSDEVEYRLEWLDATPGTVKAHFTLVVADVPGAIALVAHLAFTGDAIASITVGEDQGTPSLSEAPLRSLRASPR